MHLQAVRAQLLLGEPDAVTGAGQLTDHGVVASASASGSRSHPPRPGIHWINALPWMSRTDTQPCSAFASLPAWPRNRARVSTATQTAGRGNPESIPGPRTDIAGGAFDPLHVDAVEHALLSPPQRCRDA